MAVLNSATKGKAGVKALEMAARKPGLLRLGAQAATPTGKFGLKAGKPLLKRRVRRRAARLGETARTLGETLVTCGPQVAYEVGLAEPPKSKRTAPRVAAGALLGASAMYFLEPEHGREHREKLAELVS
jgi:hypothetical protein